MCRLRLKAQDDLGRPCACVRNFASFSQPSHALPNSQTLRARTPAGGIQVVVEVGLGLGVFAGDAIGIGNTVRHLSAPRLFLIQSKLS